VAAKRLDHWLILAPLSVAILGAAPAPNLEHVDPDILWADVLAHPGDPVLGYRYAKALVETGRLEEAAAELERVLMLAPNQPQVSLDLGVLYYTLGYQQLAATYLRQAAESDLLEPALRDRARQYLVEAEKRSARSILSGNVSFGGRYQSNATGGFEPELFSTLLGPVLRPSNLVPRPDVNMFLGFDMTHRWDLNLQREAAIVTSFDSYLTRQTAPSFYNFSGLAVRSGVEFAPLPEIMPSLRLYPYGLGTLVWLNDRYYNAGGGGGLQVNANLASSVQLSIATEGVSSSYHAAPHAPTAQLLTGSQQAVIASLGYGVNETLGLVLEGATRLFNTQRAYLSFVEYELTLGSTLLYPSPVALGSTRQWRAGASVSHYWRLYGGPDPLVDPGTVLNQSEWRFRISNEIPVMERWLLFQRVEYWTTTGNIKNYDQNNLLALIGLTKRF
jgi:tetratricopeptide (TPR) repeat protein